MATSSFQRLPTGGLLPLSFFHPAAAAVLATVRTSNKQSTQLWVSLRGERTESLIGKISTGQARPSCLVSYARHDLPRSQSFQNHEDSLLSLSASSHDAHKFRRAGKRATNCWRPRGGGPNSQWVVSFSWKRESLSRHGRFMSLRCTMRCVKKGCSPRGLVSLSHFLHRLVQRRTPC